MILPKTTTKVIDGKIEFSLWHLGGGGAPQTLCSLPFETCTPNVIVVPTN